MMGKEDYTMTSFLKSALIPFALVLALAGCDLIKPAPEETAPTAETPTIADTPTPSTESFPQDPPVETYIPEINETAAPSLPVARITVNPGSAGPVASVQAFANDVAAGDVEKIVTWCWTRSPDEIRRVFSSPNYRGAVLEALTHPGQGAMLGSTWQGNHLTLFFYNEELSSRYACPNTEFTPSEASWRIKRILAVHDGRPVHTGDGVNYALLCDAECGWIWDPRDPSGSSYVEGRRSPISNATPAQWDRLRTLSTARLSVEVLNNGYIRVRAADGSTSAVAYFTGEAQAGTFAIAYLLGEVV
jgi:hypothetical protein